MIQILIKIKGEEALKHLEGLNRLEQSEIPYEEIERRVIFNDPDIYSEENTQFDEFSLEQAVSSILNEVEEDDKIVLLEENDNKLRILDEFSVNFKRVKLELVVKNFISKRNKKEFDNYDEYNEEALIELIQNRFDNVSVEVKK